MEGECGRAKLDALSWSDPTVFILYTHANETLGDAKTSLVGRIIRWLQRSRCRVISDRPPLDRLSSARSDDAVLRDILDRQFLLLPFSGEGDSVVKLVMCGSDVLEQYMRHPFTSSYLDKVIGAYQTADGARENIREVFEAHAGQAGFHHVLTEIALLQLRKQAQNQNDLIVPVALSGELPATYLKIVDSCNVVSKQKEEDISNEHKLSFKLLRQVYLQDSSSTMDRAKDIILPKLLSATERIVEDRTTRGRLAGSINNAADRKHENERMRILVMLRTLPYLDRKNRNSVPADNTCIWATNHPKLQAWQTASRLSVLWVSANPGCGKSVLARHLIDTVFPAVSATATIYYFFFRDDSDDQRTFINTLRCMLHQLLLQDPTLITQAIVEKFQTNNQLFYSESERWNVSLQSAIRNHSQSESTSRLKFLIPSRPCAIIKTDFRDMQSDLETIHLAGQGEAELQHTVREMDIVIRVRAREL
ncbi:hypothetical protein MCOR17_004825 [Pyricularia oryzae]|nr:hypothetical protein MCOR17_004825 [Pyricularia oryzae]